MVCVDIVVCHFYRPFPSVILKKHKDSLSRLALCFDFVVFYIFALYYEPDVIFSIALVPAFVKGVNKKNGNSVNLGAKCGVKDEIYKPYH